MQVKGKYSWAKHVDFMVIDLLSLFIAFLFAYHDKFHTFHISTNWSRLIVIVSLLNVVISLFVNPYSGIFRRRYYMQIGRNAVLVVFNALVTALVFYLLKVGAAYSREVIIRTYLYYFLIATVLKYVWKKLLTSGVIKTTFTSVMSLFIISDREHIDADLYNVSSGELKLYDIKGIHLIDGTEKEIVFEDQVIPLIGEEYVRFVLDNNISEVMLAVPLEKIGTEVCKMLVDNGIGLNLVIESLLGFIPEDQYISNIGVYKALSTNAFSFTPSQQLYLIIKRISDILCGIIGLIVLLPIMGAVKLSNLATGDKAPIFYRQKRVGQNGKIINIWKFRSMIPDADEVLQEMLKEEKWKKQWDENQKFDDDPRITKAGKILRKTSIDELPQLFNVLVGDMSLVGDRVILGQTKKKPVFTRLSVA